MSNFKTREILETISQFQESGKKLESSDRNIRLATIDPYFTVGKPRVLFDGESRLTERTFSWDAAYSPRGGDRVFMMPVGQSYIIMGQVTPTTFNNVWIDAEPMGQWIHFPDAAWQKLRYTMTAGGVVSIQGMVRWNGPAASEYTTEAEALVMVLPERFRPRERMHMISQFSGGYFRTRVDTDGSVRAFVWKASAVNWINVSMTFSSEYGVYEELPLNSPWTSGTGESPRVAKDSYDRIWMTGYINGLTGTPTANSNITTLPVGWRPNGSNNFATVSGFNHDLLTVSTTGVVTWKVGQSQQAIDLNYISYSLPSVTGFETLSLSNNWINYGGSFWTPSVKKHTDGLVELRGHMKGGTVPAVGGAVNIGVLPEGCRPSKYIMVPALSVNKLIRIDITPSGNITAHNTGNNPLSSGWISLDSIKFVV